MDTPATPHLPKVDPVLLPDVATEPHPRADPAAGLGPIPVPHPGLGDDPDIADGFKPLSDLAKPQEEAPTEG